MSELQNNPKRSESLDNIGERTENPVRSVLFPTDEITRLKVRIAELEGQVKYITRERDLCGQLCGIALDACRSWCFDQEKKAAAKERTGG